MLSRRHVLAGSSALSLLRNKPAKAAIAPNYVLNLGSVTAPALPRELTPNVGTWLTTSSISPNAIYTTSVGSGTYTKLFFPGSSSSSTAFSFTVQYANTSAPTNSYCYPGFQSSGRNRGVQGRDLDTETFWRQHINPQFVCWGIGNNVCCKHGLHRDDRINRNKHGHYHVSGSAAFGWIVSDIIWSVVINQTGLHNHNRFIFPISPNRNYMTECKPNSSGFLHHRMVRQ